MVLRRFASLKAINYYDILNITRKATQKEIKVAYLKQCKILHPDQNPNDPTAHKKFIILTEAYKTLSDEKNRQNYDLSMLEYSN
jgi:DnaJ-related protein SCJ1